MDLERAGVGLDLAADPTYVITSIGDASSGPAFLAPSCSYGAHKKYTIFRDEDAKWKCTCLDYLSRRKPCKHVVAVVKRYAPGEAPILTESALKTLRKARLALAAAHDPIERIRAPHVPHVVGSHFAESTLKDRALVGQRDRVRSLLGDLSKTLNRSEPKSRVPGGQLISPGDLAVLMLFREYTGLSQRRFDTEMTGLLNDGYISATRSRASLCEYQNSARTHEILMEVFRLVISVFRLESTFYIDGTGLSPYYVSNYFEKTHHDNPLRSGTPWVHCHAVIGGWSKAILGFQLTEHSGSGTGEITQFPILLNWLKANGFKNGKYVGADNLYLFDQCFEAAKLYGMDLIGPTQPRNFDKKTGAPASAEIAHMLKIIAERGLDRDVKLRAIIEAVFSEIKRDGKHMIKCVGSTAERTAQPGVLLYTSRRNELLCRVIVQVLKRINVMEVMTGHKVSFKDEQPFSTGAFSLMRDKEVDE